MATKKTVKKKEYKRLGKAQKKVKAKLIKSAEVTKLVRKLKATRIPMLTIAKDLGYTSHNTVKHWFAGNCLPDTKIKAITALVAKAGK